MPKLNTRELVRAIRDATIAEHAAIKQYETVADSTNHAKAKAVLQDIANEEKAHVGELQKLLSLLDPQEDESLAEGKEEVKEAGLICISKLFLN